jgi:hypothetical protein
MAVDPVPWMIENGASHSTNVVRNVAFAAFGGNEGLVSAPDFEVRELASPGTSIRVFPGTCAIKNRAAGIRDEMYVGRADTETVVPISGTGGSVRYDMIVAQVENPWLSGEPWADPPSNADGPYFFVRVISNVSATAKTLADAGLSGNSAIPLARIAIPASTSTITQAMITDLRSISNPHKSREFNVTKPASGTQTLVSNTYVTWPSSADLTVDVPSWATHCKVRAFVAGVYYGAAGNNGGAGWEAAGNLRVAFVGNVDTVVGPTTPYNMHAETGIDRAVMMTAATGLAIPVANRGKAAIIRLQGNKNVSGPTTSIVADVYTTSTVEVEFYNAAESNL